MSLNTNGEAYSDYPLCHMLFMFTFKEMSSKYLFSFFKFQKLIELGYTALCGET